MKFRVVWRDGFDAKTVFEFLKTSSEMSSLVHFLNLNHSPKLHDIENSCQTADMHFQFKVSAPTRFSVAFLETDNAKPYTL